MNQLLHEGLLLAERSRLDNLSGTFRQRAAGARHDEVFSGLLILAGIIVAIWLLSRLLAYQKRRRTVNSPRKLFLALCRIHALPWSDRWLLWRLAKSRRLADPARVFLEPTLYDQLGLDRSWAVQWPRLDALRSELFFQPPSEEKSPPRSAKPGQGLPPVTPLLPPAPSPMLDIPPWVPLQEAATRG
ncbi:MAG: hypothetical protein ABSG68_12495 [Thermoguttaceae bacterium]|jgi:hypothetical protein